MTSKRFEERLDEIYQLGREMRKPGGDKLAESRYKVVVAELMLLILDSLHVLRTGLYILLGAFIAIIAKLIF